MKSLWFVIFPIQFFVLSNEGPSSWFLSNQWLVVFPWVSRPRTPPSSLIAVHFAMSIFRTHHSRAAGGLEPYRFYVYAVWLGFPVLMASLVFVDCDRGYGNFGQYCYVPNRPIWCRLVLSCGSSIPDIYHNRLSCGGCVSYTHILLRKYGLEESGAKNVILGQRQKSESERFSPPCREQQHCPTLAPASNIVLSERAGPYRAPAASPARPAAMPPTK